MRDADDSVLADGERVFRRYECTSVDRVAVFAGSVIPLPGSVESAGTITLTNKRVLFDLRTEAGSGRLFRRTTEGSYMHQEVRISDVSSISSMMSRFGRDLRVPLLCILLGLALMLLPYLAFDMAGDLDKDGDYREGYNDGVEYAYFTTYLDAIQDKTVSHMIPDGYYFSPPDEPWTKEYRNGYNKGFSAGYERAVADIGVDAEFSVPHDLIDSNDPSFTILVLAAIGTAVFITGSIIFWISNRTKEWVRLRLGSGSKGIYMTSMKAGSSMPAVTPDNQYWDMARELGSAILIIRAREGKVFSPYAIFDREEPEYVREEDGTIPRLPPQPVPIEDDAPEASDEAQPSYDAPISDDIQVFDDVSTGDSQPAEDDILVVDDVEEDSDERCEDIVGLSCDGPRYDVDMYRRLRC